MKLAFPITEELTKKAKKSIGKTVLEQFGVSLNTVYLDCNMLSILIPTYNYSIFALVKKVHEQCMEAHVPFEICCLDDQSKNSFQLENQAISTLSNKFNKSVNYITKKCTIMIIMLFFCGDYV